MQKLCRFSLVLSFFVCRSSQRLLEENETPVSSITIKAKVTYCIAYEKGHLRNPFGNRDKGIECKSRDKENS